MPTFYALHDSRTPVAISMATVLLNVVLNVTLVRVIGYAGLALGTAAASLFNAALLLWLLRKRLHGLDGRRIAVAFAKIAVASLVMGAAAWQVNAWLTSMVAGQSVAARLLRVGSAITLALIVLVGAARALRIAEFGDAIAGVRRRFSAGGAD